MLKIKKGDTVVVTIGKDKNHKGKVEQVFPKDGKAMVAGVNIVKRHFKKRDEKNPGGIIDVPKPIDVSKLAVICPACHKPTRVGFLVVKNDKYRICHKCQQKI